MNIRIPTFEEYKANRDRFLGRDDDALAQIDAGSQALKKVVTKYIYEIEGYRCRSLEEVERVAISQGIPLHALDYRPVMLPGVGQKGEVLVKIISKLERDQRDARTR